MIAAGAIGTPSSSAMYRDRSGELMPIMVAVAPGTQWPPRARTSPWRTASQTSSPSIRTPSRSKTTASSGRRAAEPLDGWVGAIPAVCGRSAQATTDGRFVTVPAPNRPAAPRPSGPTPFARQLPRASITKTAPATPCRSAGPDGSSLHQLPVGVLAGDLVALELEQVAAAHLDPLPLDGGPGEQPLRTAPVPADPVPVLAVVDIGEAGEAAGQPRPHLLPPPGPAAPTCTRPRSRTQRHPRALT